jgi:hypothetical protein
MHRFIVYQYGKVGSTSLVNALNTMPETQAFQSHFLGKDAFTQTLERLQDPLVSDYFFEHSAGQLIENLRIYRHYASRGMGDNKLTVITVTREPFDWFRSCIAQDIAQHLTTFRTTLEKKNVAFSSDAEALKLGLQLLFQRILQAVEHFGSVDALCAGKRYTLHRELEIPEPVEFKSFMFFLNIFLRPHTWFASHLKKEMDCDVRDMTPLSPVASCKRFDWGNIYLLRYESLSEGFSQLQDDLGYKHRITLPHSNDSRDKLLSGELDAIFLQPEAQLVKALCHSQDTQFLGYC